MTAVTVVSGEQPSAEQHVVSRATSDCIGLAQELYSVLESLVQMFLGLLQAWCHGEPVPVPNHTLSE